MASLMITQGDNEFNRAKHREREAPGGTVSRVIGIDLGGGKGKNTAVALGEVTPTGLEIHAMGTRAPTGVPWYDSELLAFLLAQPPGTLVAMDAPLGLPACVRCRLPVCPGYAACPDEAVRWMRTEGERLDRELRARVSKGKPRVTPYTQRVCELRLRAHTGLMPRETLGQGMGPLTARAAHLRRALAGQYRRDEGVIEVYPKATIHQLAGPEAARGYKRRAATWATRARILESWSRDLTFRTWREESLRCDHTFDAVVAAYAGWLFTTQGWRVPEGMTQIATLEGWIWYPGCDAALRDDA